MRIVTEPTSKITAKATLTIIMSPLERITKISSCEVSLKIEKRNLFRSLFLFSFLIFAMLPTADL